MLIYPSRDLELDLISRHGLVVGMDEVGRGSLAGPLAVGAVLVSESSLGAPEGLADSKLIPPAKREALIKPIREWCEASAVGWSSPTEISELGVSAALRLAGSRALAMIEWRSRHFARCVLLDGNYNWLANPEPDLFDPFPDRGSERTVVTQIKADQSACVVAAASVLAKVARDHHMSSLPDPGYGWAENKGYASPAHIAQLRTLGPGQYHRMGWKLPGV